MPGKHDDCEKCGNGEYIREGLPDGYWLECNNCGFIPTVE